MKNCTFLLSTQTRNQANISMHSQKSHLQSYFYNKVIGKKNDKHEDFCIFNVSKATFNLPISTIQFATC